MTIFCSTRGTFRFRLLLSSVRWFENKTYLKDAGIGPRISSESLDSLIGEGLACSTSSVCGSLSSGEGYWGCLAEDSGVLFSRLSDCFDLCLRGGGISPGDKDRLECLRLCL